MTPHLVRWQSTYGARGLQVVYVDEGSRDDQARAMAYARDHRVTVFHDARSTANQTYGVRAYPTAYVLDPSGTVVWEGIPHFDPAATERAIRAALPR